MAETPQLPVFLSRVEQLFKALGEDLQIPLSSGRTKEWVDGSRLGFQYDPQNKLWSLGYTNRAGEPAVLRGYHAPFASFGEFKGKKLEGTALLHTSKELQSKTAAGADIFARAVAALRKPGVAKRLEAQGFKVKQARELLNDNVIRPLQANNRVIELLYPTGRARNSTEQRVYNELKRLKLISPRMVNGEFAGWNPRSSEQAIQAAEEINKQLYGSGESSAKSTPSLKSVNPKKLLSIIQQIDPEIRTRTFDPDAAKKTWARIEEKRFNQQRGDVSDSGEERIRGFKSATPQQKQAFRDRIQRLTEMAAENEARNQERGYNRPNKPQQILDRFYKENPELAGGLDEALKSGPMSRKQLSRHIDRLVTLADITMPRKRKLEAVKEGQASALTALPQRGVTAADIRQALNPPSYQQPQVASLAQAAEALRGPAIQRMVREQARKIQEEQTSKLQIDQLARIDKTLRELRRASTAQIPKMLNSIISLGRELEGQDLAGEEISMSRKSFVEAARSKIEGLAELSQSSQPKIRGPARTQLLSIADRLGIYPSSMGGRDERLREIFKAVQDPKSLTARLKEVHTYNEAGLALQAIHRAKEDLAPGADVMRWGVEDAKTVARTARLQQPTVYSPSQLQQLAASYEIGEVERPSTPRITYARSEGAQRPTRRESEYTLAQEQAGAGRTRIVPNDGARGVAPTSGRQQVHSDDTSTLAGQRAAEIRRGVGNYARLKEQANAIRLANMPEMDLPVEKVAALPQSRAARAAEILDSLKRQRAQAIFAQTPATAAGERTLNPTGMMRSNLDPSILGLLGFVSGGSGSRPAQKQGPMPEGRPVHRPLVDKPRPGMRERVPMKAKPGLVAALLRNMLKQIPNAPF